MVMQQDGFQQRSKTPGYEVVAGAKVGTKSRIYPMFRFTNVSNVVT
jgi:hypothetical protein